MLIKRGNSDTLWHLGLHKAQISLCLLYNTVEMPNILIENTVMKLHGQVFKVILYWGGWSGDWSEGINTCKVGRDHYLIGLVWINQLMAVTGLQIPQPSRNPKLCWNIYIYLLFLILLTLMWLMEGNPKGSQSWSQTIISREVFLQNSMVVFAVARRGSGSWQ